MASGMRKIGADWCIDTLPLSDGGEGLVDALVAATGGERIAVTVRDPLMRPIEAFYGILGDGQCAVIEMAAASGLALLEEDERDPWITTTYGTGQLIAAALDRGCKEIIVGIGGSATNDGGAGMAEALGARLLEADGRQSRPGGGALDKLVRIDTDALHPGLKQARIRVACDVSNPLTGGDGAAAVYAPQKGANPLVVKELDKRLRHWADVIRTQLGIEVEQVPGAGAAGGLGAGLMAFCSARLEPGFSLVAGLCGLEGAITKADLVVTGEGKIDGQTRFGKTPQGVAELARKHGKPLIAVAGTIGEGAQELYASGFSLILPIVDRPMALSDALASAPDLLEKTGERIARMMRIRF